MSFYLSTPMNVSTRRMLNRWFSDWAEVAPEVSFPIDVMDDGEAYTISALLPGLTSDDVNIQIQNNVVSLQGELRNDINEKATYLVAERPAGKFSRSIGLPDVVDTTKAEAALVNGVLTLRLPKAETAKPRSIKVNIK